MCRPRIIRAVLGKTKRSPSFPGTKFSGSAGSEPPNRVVLLQFANMDAVKAWRKEGEADLENDVGEKYAKFRVYAIEGVMQ